MDLMAKAREAIAVRISRMPSKPSDASIEGAVKIEFLALSQAQTKKIPPKDLYVNHIRNYHAEDGIKYCGGECQW